MFQVFGGLLTAKPDEEGQDETDSPAPPEGEKESAKPEDEVREHVVDFLSCQGKLSGLQKQVSGRMEMGWCVQQHLYVYIHLRDLCIEIVSGRVESENLD